MSLKKLLGIISVIIIVVFSMMLTTSYAWYSFENASTNFEVATNNDNVIISYHTGEYINTTIAVPIKSAQVEKYAERSNFSVRVKDGSIDNEMVATISLDDISINSYLQDVDFKVELYHQSSKIATIAGNTIGVSGATTKVLGNVVLDNDVDNNFEVRVYILDDGTDQSTLMNRTFQAKIKVDVVSRLKVSFTDYANPDIYVSSITIDGESSNSLPVDGHYDMTASCNLGSTLSWDTLSKTLIYGSGSKSNDVCSLTFTSSTTYQYLSDMPAGSYVAYTGNNGCKGAYCNGKTANSTSNTLGSCLVSETGHDYKFYGSGWRIAYIEDDRAYLVSAGAPECVNTKKWYTTTSSESLSASTAKAYFGSGYKLDEDTGYFSLTGVTDQLYDGYYEFSTIQSTPYTCFSDSKTATCSTLYKVISVGSGINTTTYTASFSHLYSSDLQEHYDKLNDTSLKYCNRKYASGGVCDSTTAWAMNGSDFEKITGSTLATCARNGSVTCGYSNDLINIGGYYWLANQATTVFTYYWNPRYRLLLSYGSGGLIGLRPVIKLDTAVVVTGGSGTSENPYLIDKGERAASMITFYIEGTEFTTTAGTTWETFINSNLNEDGYFYTGLNHSAPYLRIWDDGVVIAASYESGIYLDDYYLNNSSYDSVYADDEIESGVNYNIE